MSALNFHMADMYPNMGLMNTRLETQPEAYDQQALIDNEKMAKENPIRTAGEHTSIWKSILLVFIIIALLTMKW